MIELIFIIASVLLSIGTFLFYRIQKEYRYKKWLYIRIGLIVSMALMGFAIYFSFFNVNGTDDEYVNQIEKLEKAQKSLDDLDEYIESQKELIKKNETYIDKLSKKKKNLEEVVKTKQETADALFREFENRYQKRKWTERIISFII